MQLTSVTFKKVVSLVSNGIKLADALRQVQCGPLEFFEFLNNNPTHAMNFEKARQIAVETMLDDSISAIDLAEDKFNLDKASAKLRASQWLAEKLISKTYGNKVDVSHTHTVDIRSVLDEAVKRVQVESSVVQSLPPVQNDNDPEKMEDADLV